MATKITGKKTGKKTRRKKAAPAETTVVVETPPKPELQPMLSEVELNLMTVDDAIPPPRTGNDVTDRELLEGKLQDVYEHGMRIHPCGLPDCMCLPGAGRKIIAQYLATHDVSHGHLTGLEITETERTLHSLYRPMPSATGLVDVMYFAAALRLWKKGMPIDPQKALNLNDMKVEG